MFKAIHSIVLGSEERLSQDLKVQFSEYREKDGFERIAMLAKLLSVTMVILLCVDVSILISGNQGVYESYFVSCHMIILMVMTLCILCFESYKRQPTQMAKAMSYFYYFCIFLTGSALLLIEFVELIDRGNGGVFIIFIFALNLFLPLRDKERWGLSTFFFLTTIVLVNIIDVELYQRMSHIINNSVSYVLAVFLGLYHYRKYYISNFVQRIELEAHNRKLQGVTVEQDHFARVLAHDLKEPLRTIKSFSDLLRRDLERIPGGLSQNNKDFLDFVGNGAQRMHFMIDELRMYVEVTNFSEIGNNCSFAHSALRVRQDLYELIAETNSQLSFPKTDHYLLVSEQHLVLVLQNIINNAIRYCKQPIPIVTIDAEAKGNELWVSVKDNGVGISEEDLPYIFDLFWRSNRTRAKGSGIGLSTCKKLVEQYGGRLWVESKVGQGSTFYFTLPLK